MTKDQVSAAIQVAVADAMATKADTDLIHSLPSRADLELLGASVAEIKSQQESCMCAVPVPLSFSGGDSPYHGDWESSWSVTNSGQTASFIDTTAPGGSGHGTIWTDGAKNAGKWYVEVTVDQHDINGGIGLRVDDSLYSTVYHDNQVCCVGHGTTDYPLIGRSSYMADGTVLGFALDIDNGSLELYADGANVGSMSDLQPNLDFTKPGWKVAAFDGSSAENKMQVTIRATPKYTIPSGYTYWYSNN
jgi:hypothetical protein